MTETTQLGGLLAIPTTDVHPSPNNPRERMTEIEGLAASIKENGLIQPLVVQKIPGQPGYQIVAGHRRYVAAKSLGWAKIPCIVRRDMLPDEELLAMLVENGQRAGLDPIEEARALAKLKTQTGMSDASLASKLGLSMSRVSTRIALLALSVEEQEELRAKQISIGASVQRARIASGKVKPGAKGKRGPQHLSIHHSLGNKARARCVHLGHMKAGSTKGIGGIACGQCWESVIRANEREQLHNASAQLGRCVLCDREHEPDALAEVV